MPDQLISKTLVKTFNTLQVAAVLYSQIFNFHYKAWSGVATSGFLVASYDQCQSIQILLDLALIGIG